MTASGTAKSCVPGDRGAAGVGRFCDAPFDEARFVDLSEDQQDTVLTGLDEEEIQFDGVSAKVFFDLLLKNAIEGFFADPIYGGNRDMIAWRYIGFPGTRYDYRDFVDHRGKAIPLEPVSLMGRPGWSRP